jgi:histidine ammonia-lyase
MTFTLVPGALTLSQMHAWWRKPEPLRLEEAAWQAVATAEATVAALLASGKVVYGVNTGFGILARERIPLEQVEELQRRLVLSHMAGVGKALPAKTVRLILLLKIASLARGHSGVRRQTLQALLRLLEAKALPVIPAQGSVGASGDLAPLAHLSGALIGEGEVWLQGEQLPAAAALGRIGLEPLRLGAKEGLALLNGTQVSTALALEGLFRAQEVAAAALAAGAMSVDACAASDTPFDPRIQAVRLHPGQQRAAAALRRLLAGSAIRESHREDDPRVQDPYSLRCQPQVMGAVLDVLAAAGTILEREANAVSDNPLVFPAEGEMLSGGNFHAEPVGMAAEMIALALAETGALSERRVALLTDATLSGLPAFLIARPGLNSGFMIAHVTAAALASENKQLSHPAVVDSLPTSANQEDHVSMATHGAYRLKRMAANTGRIVAIELLAAAQGIDLRRPLATGPALAALHGKVREKAAFLEIDRPFAPDIEAVYQLVRDGSFLGEVWSEDRPW